jgi:hypothetical protein
VIDKSVLHPDYNGIQRGMLVLPNERSTRSILWRGPMTSPGLVLEVVPVDERGGTVAVVLAAGGRVIVPTASLRRASLPDEDTEEIEATRG